MPRAVLASVVALLAAVSLARGALYVESVLPDSPAAAAGLQDGDRIARLDGRAIDNIDDLQEVTGARSPGDTVAMSVEREGETVELELTFGERPDGGASIGVRLRIEFEPGEGPSPGTEQCLAWIDDTYRIESLQAELDLEFPEELAEALACVEHDTSRMPSSNAIKYCDNVFKVHCAGLDIVSLLAEALVDRCEDALKEELSDPETTKAWRTCGQNTVYDGYSIEGKVVDATGCRRALRDCGVEVEASAAWTVWGGPDQAFRAPASVIADHWPASGPPRLWSRELGNGYSAILYEDDRLYTMVRDGAREGAVCLDARTGETLWERLDEQPPHARHLSGYGDGPNSTPLLAGDLLFTIGVAGHLQALRKSDGEPVWSAELWGEPFNGNFQGHGYSSSPAAWKDLVIVPVGGKDAAVVAFEQQSGEIRWRLAGFENSHSTPRLVEIGGRTQLLVFMAEEIIALDPDSGELAWSYPQMNQWRHNITLPSVAGDDVVFISSPQAGARGLQIDGEEETAQVEELWSSRRVQFYHATTVQEGDWIYGSSGMMSPAFMTAVNARTGEIGWRERGIAKANCVAAGDKLIVLDEDGMLYLATATPDAFEVHSRTQLFDGVAWTVPTLVGTTLYARDNSRIVALDLG